MSNKLDMSLDQLIKTAGKKKPAGGQGAKKPVKTQAQKGKPGAKQQQQQKGKAGMQMQKKGVQVGLKAKGGIAKPGAKAGVAKPAAGKAGLQQKPGHQKLRQGMPDVRVVPRPRPGAGPATRFQARPAAGRPMGGRPMGGRGFMGGQGPMGMGMGPMGGGMGGMQGGMGPMGMGGGMGGMGGMGMGGMGMQAGPGPVAPPQQGKWQNDLFDGSVVSSSTSAKLFISNLDFKVTDDDVKELFGTVGVIKESAINYDKSGRSMGTATVVFERRQDALAAFNRYNNVALDNKKMNIEVVETAVPRGTFKTLSSGINVSRQTAQGGAAGGARGRGVPHGDFMQE